MTVNELYDEEYYEKGLVTGKSCYMNYRWMPELTLKMAYHLINHLKLKESDKVLDYGCAKGFLVKALRILDIPAFGCDISGYAIDNAEADIRHHCSLIESSRIIPFDFDFDWIITKDVLEHMDERSVDSFLKHSYSKANRAFHVIPLGNHNDGYIIPEYDKDPSHMLAKNAKWWKNKFESFGWVQTSFSHNVKGIKDNWTERYKEGNGFFILEKNN